tara:strand:+ start:396 stop:662 length:267 start_codon:yes stop_codon:yes gene_type:complete
LTPRVVVVARRAHTATRSTTRDGRDRRRETDAVQRALRLGDALSATRGAAKDARGATRGFPIGRRARTRERALKRSKARWCTRAVTMD